MARAHAPGTRRRIMERFDTRGIDWVVLGWSLGLVVLFCIAGAIWPEQVGAWGSAGLGWVVSKLGWIFVIAATGFVVFAVILAFSRYGRIPLGQEGEEPEFSTTSWVAMMFSAGMGIGLIFYGVYEPVQHMANPAPWQNVQAGTEPAARQGLAYSFFHWGLHPWAIYAVVALAMAYSTFRKGRGNLISAPFQALLGKERVVDRGWGRPIDIWAIVSTKFGGATSLGLGALQVGAGIYLFTGFGSGFGEQRGFPLVPLLVIAVLIVFAVFSALSGVAKGIRWLSNGNLVLAALLALFVFAVGPTVYILNVAPTGLASYAFWFIPWSFETPLSQADASWLSSWTIFYWAWWISWTPFVSTFIARISRGRTIRQFVLGVLIVPTAVSVVWFSVLGGAGLDLQRTGQADIAGGPSAAAAFFQLLQHYPGYTVTGILVMFLTAIFWVSGADASALVLGMLSTRGNLTPHDWLVAMWAVMSAAVAAVLLIVGGLGALQTFTILVASPFVLIITGMCWSLFVDIRHDPLRRRTVESVQDVTPVRLRHKVDVPATPVGEDGSPEPQVIRVPSSTSS